MTYMNLSGESVQAAASYYKIATERVLIAYDELDLPPGRVQLKFDGGGAGHNGIGSVIEHIGTKFWRLRFGVGHPRDREQAAGRRKQVIDHVLKRASAEDEALILGTLGDAVKTIPVILEQGAERAKNKLHQRKAPDNPAPDTKKEQSE
jgi:PTH1 family peptidyl-tRNA hydrolase